MKKLLKIMLAFSLVLFLSVGLVACNETNDNKGGSDSKPAETVELTKAMLSDVEFENSEAVEIKQDDSTYTISGTIDAMSDSQKTAYGVEDVTHVVILKFTFDKERTLSEFEIEGSTTKVYSDSQDVENYAGSLTELLDNGENEDAYCNLILSAHTESYRLTATYTDGTESTIEIKITATLATATED